MNDCSDRDKEIFDAALKKVAQGQNQFNKEMNQSLMDTNRVLDVTPEQAIFDNGDPNSRNNKYVAQIQSNDNLTAEEKERLLKNHEAGLAQLGDLMAMDKKRQEQELDRILKERLERRRKLKEKQFATEIKAEGKEAEAKLNQEYEQKTNDFIAQNNQEKQDRITAVL